MKTAQTGLTAVYTPQKMREYRSIKISYFSMKNNISKKNKRHVRHRKKNSNICGIESQKKKRSEAEATFREIIARNFTNG